MSDNRDKKIIEALKQIECDCGYHFRTIEDDMHLYTMSEIMWMENFKFKGIICPGCKKKIFNTKNIEHYLRNQKLKKICQKI